MTLHDRLSALFMHHLFATPEGRAHLLNQIADAEDNGEAAVFDHVLAVIDDPALAKAVEHHRADELRHAALFRARRDAQGVPTGPVPRELQMLERIDERLDGFFGRPITDARGIVTAYLALQVIEERALTQFAMFEAAFSRVDPETARVFAEVAADEERHLKYCKAIVKRYADSERAAAEELARLRAIEVECFADTTAANLEYSLARGLIRGAGPRAFWRAMQWVGQRVEVRPPTRFAAQPA